MRRKCLSELLWQIENNKTTVLCSVSRGYQADRVPWLQCDCWPISAEFEPCNEPGGNKGSLITTPKPSCRPPQPAPQIPHWQPSHSWVLQSLLCSLQSLSKWTEHMGMKFLGFFFVRIFVFMKVWMKSSGYWVSCRQKATQRGSDTE